VTTINYTNQATTINKV